METRRIANFIRWNCREFPLRSGAKDTNPTTSIFPTKPVIGVGSFHFAGCYFKNETAAKTAPITTTATALITV